MKWQGLINQYKEFLPVNENTPMVSLYEGNTPLIKSLNLSKELGIDLYFKFEGLNPTGSFKRPWYVYGNRQGHRRRV